MIDNIRFTFEYNNDKEWLNSLKQNINLSKKFKNGNGSAYIGKLYFDVNRLNKKKIGSISNTKSSSLLIQIKEINSGICRINIMNSMRKWYFYDSFYRDFTKKEFSNCMELISNKINVPLEVILESTVTRVEYGGNLNLRESYKCFHNCIYSHKDLPKKVTYSGETLKFHGENKKVIFYDKITEHKNKDKITAEVQKALNKKALSLRYEISKTKIVKGDLEYKYMKRLGNIIEYWDNIADLWYNELDKIIFVNNMSPKIYDYLKDTQIKNMTEFLTYLGLEKLGIENLQTILSDRALLKKRGILNKKYTEIFNKYKNLIEEEDFEYIFRQKVLQKRDEFKA